ncbi:MAG: HD domain-containing protein [Oscillospiraceae bacterium]|nr:HD domain-containing protein [Oscillospiraceae bacterium]
MEYNKLIEDFHLGDEIEGFYILKSAVSRVSSSGKPFLAAVLSDRTGNIDAKVWDYSGPVGSVNEGSVIKIRGTVSEFRGAPQITLSRIRTAQNSDSYQLDTLVPIAPIDAKDAGQELRELVDSIEDPDYREICLKMLDRYGEQFYILPGGKSMHHSFLHGLLMHTLNMVRAADFLANLYEEVIDRSLLVAGTFLHDFAKCDEFVVSQLGLVTDYSLKGQLLGHLVMGAQEVASIAKELNVPEEKSVLLQHLLLSHHGEPEFGAAVRPQCAESELLALIDLIDSRMEIYAETFVGMQPGQFSKRVFALDKKIYKHQS